METRTTIPKIKSANVPPTTDPIINAELSSPEMTGFSVVLLVNTVGSAVTSALVVKDAVPVVVSAIGSVVITSALFVALFVEGTVPLYVSSVLLCISSSAMKIIESNENVSKVKCCSTSNRKGVFISENVLKTEWQINSEKTKYK